MLRLQLLVCIATFALAAGIAQANPFSIQVMRTRALPGPHVQITYGLDWNYVPLDIPVEPPTLAATFGTKQTPWVTGNYVTNTGSGLAGLRAIQRCDCFVPMGRPLTYSATVMYPGFDATVITLSSTITVSDSFDAAPPPDSYPDSPDADARPDVRPGSGPEVEPWSIPDPVEVQGVDCTTVCPEFTPDASIAAPDAPTPIVDALITSVDTRIPTIDAPIAVADASTAAPDAPVAPADAPIVAAPVARTTTAGGSKGCSFGGTCPLSALSLVAVLALLIGRRRRGS